MSWLVRENIIASFLAPNIESTKNCIFILTPCQKYFGGNKLNLENDYFFFIYAYFICKSKIVHNVSTIK